MASNQRGIAARRAVAHGAAGRIVELAQSSIAAFNAGDVTGFARSFDAEAVVHGDVVLSDRDVYRGRRGAADWMNEARRRWTRTSLCYVAVEARPPAVLLVVDLIASTPRGGGAWRLYLALDLAAGYRIRTLHTCHDRDTARARLGWDRR